MTHHIQGLHHVTSLASGAVANNAFFTKVLGLRRVKKTVNFDNPHVYHLYYGNARGDQGSVMTYFPFEGAKRGTHGTGEVAETNFSVPKGSLDAWQNRLASYDVAEMARDTLFGAARLRFNGPDGDGFALIETDDARPHWGGADIAPDMAVRGFQGASIRLADTGAMAELLGFMGYAQQQVEGDTVRFAVENGNGANVIDLQKVAADPAQQGAGSVHHIAFSVKDRAAQLDIRKALLDTGYQVTPVIDRNYFWAIYFRTPGGVLFEIATDEPGFDHDESRDTLGQALKLPPQHSHLRDVLEAKYLAPISD